MEPLILVVAGLVTWSLRASFIAVGSTRDLPAASERLLGYTRPAILAALVASALLARGGGDPFAVPLGWIAAALATVVTARGTGNLALSVAAGLATAFVTSSL